MFFFNPVLFKFYISMISKPIVIYVLIRGAFDQWSARSNDLALIFWSSTPVHHFSRIYYLSSPTDVEYQMRQLFSRVQCINFIQFMCVYIRSFRNIHQLKSLGAILLFGVEENQTFFRFLIYFWKFAMQTRNIFQ